MMRESLENALRENPKLKKPLIAAIIVWVAMLVAAGVAVFVIGYEDHIRTNTVRKVTERIVSNHNASACSIRILVEGARTRALQSLSDPSLSTSARDRAIESVKSDNEILRGQITEPTTLDCVAFLKRIGNVLKTVPDAKVAK